MSPEATDSTDPFPAPPPQDGRPGIGLPSSGDEPGSGQSGSGSRRNVWIVAVLVIVLAGVAGLWLGRSRTGDTAEPPPDTSTVAETPDEGPDALPEDVELTAADLYFAGADGRLYAERRELPVAPPAERARSLVAALLAGPEGGTSSGLRAPLPAGSRVEAVYLLGATALLDLRPPEPPADPDAPESVGPPTPAEAKLRRLSYGSKQELLAVYSLVNTVVMGVEGVDSVQILWDGRQPETLAGHVDTTRPLRADPSFLASQ